MKQYIDKDTLMAEIKSYKDGFCDRNGYPEDSETNGLAYDTLCNLEDSIDSLEVKEVEENFERPNINIKDVIEVSSRMKYIDEDLKPIADFIMGYASWNLHKDEWNQPVLEVPLFRVLDALVQRGKPYCCSD